MRSNQVKKMHCTPAAGAQPLTLIAHACKGLGACNDFDDVFSLAVRTLERLNLSGGIQLRCFGFKRNKFFGRGLSAKSIKRIGDLVELPPKNQLEQNIHRDKNFLIIKNAQSLIAINARDLPTQNPDTLNDNLALFTEAVQQWVEHYTGRIEAECAAAHKKYLIMEDLHKALKHLDGLCAQIQTNFSTTSANFRMKVSTNLPILNLTSEQTIFIQEMLSTNHRSQHQLMASQLALYEELKQLVIQSMHSMHEEGVLETYPASIKAGPDDLRDCHKMGQHKTGQSRNFGEKFRPK